MKKKNILSIILVVILITGIAGTGIYFAKKIKKNGNQEKMVLTVYENIKKEVLAFNTARSKYYEKTQDGLLPEMIDSNYAALVKVLDEYTKDVDDIHKTISKIEKICTDKKYSKITVAHKCEASLLAYEKTANYYVKDINDFNEVIKLYQENYDKPKDEIDYYELKYDYIDVNHDGIYDGKGGQVGKEEE